MRILLVSQHFYPESFILNDLVKCLVLDGHVVEVLTGKPNYPDGVIFPGYKAGGVITEYFDNSVFVHRVPIFPRGKGNAIRLLMNYISFVLSGLFYFYRLVQKKKIDVIFTWTPISTAIPAIYLSKRLKTHLAVWVQDLWPETLSATGYVQSRFLLKMVGRLVHWIYACTDTILVQSEAFCKPVAHYAAEEKIVYYPNSYLPIADELVAKNQIPSDLLSEFEHNDCLLFAGNLGKAQSVETLIQTAELLKHLTDFKLILVGSGSMSSWIEQKIVEKGINNVVLAGRFPSTVMPTLFSLAMGLLVTLKQHDVFSQTIPSKIQAYLFAGRPIIAGLDGEGARIVRESGAGFSSPSENPVALAENIEKLYLMPLSKREELGQAGRRYFFEHFDMRRQSKRLIEILETRIKKA